MKDRRNIRWRWGGVAALSMMILSFYPQIHFWVVRGSEWNGSYAAIEGVGDEIAYSAYVNALIDGRPRRNDPYTGRDYRNGENQTHSLFSIQFVPAYLIAIPARLLGLSAATAFILLSPLAAGATALALFWLLTLATGKERVAAAGVIVVLCLGTLVGGHGHFSSFFGQAPLYNYLMFLRRYQPAATFPLFALFCGTVWLSITLQSKAKALAAATAASVIFALLVFSYVYLWTAAAAWMICLSILWAVARPKHWLECWRSFALIGVGALAALICFAVSFSNRAATMDSVTALELSRAPDLFRVPELLGLGLLAALGYFCWRRSICIRNPRILLAASFALLPLVVFNQQVITGHSLQPLHYEMFVANYSVLIAAIGSFAAILKDQSRLQIRIPRKALLWLTLAAFEWGAYETLVATRGSMPFDHELDNARPVAMRLAELAKHEAVNGMYPTLLATDLLVADSLPTNAPQSVLWAPHMLVFSGVTDVEGKERFYQYLHYTGVSAEQLRSILITERRYGFAVGLFGFERTIRGLSRHPKPIGSEELQTELERYSEYSSAFGAEQASKVKISYVVASTDKSVNLGNLDQWYERDEGERIGKFILFRTRLRDAVSKHESGTAGTDD
jgi:hypothetical protein